MSLIWRSGGACLAESYAGRSAATGRVTQVGQVRGDGLDKKGHRGFPGWGFGRGGPTQSQKKTLCSENIRDALDEIDKQTMTWL